MKNMKYMIAAIVALSMLFVVAFAAEVKLDSNPIAYTSGDVTISIYAAADSSISGGCSFSIMYDTSKWAFVSGSEVFADGLTTDGFVGANGSYENAIDVMLSMTQDKTITNGQKLVDVKFSPVDGADVIGSSFYLEDVDGNFYTGGYEATATVDATPLSIVASATTIASTSYTDKDGKVWENVPNATCTLTGVTGTKIAGTIDINYTEGGTDKKATGVAATALEGLNLSNANVTFTVAIVGVPDTITVNSFVPNLTVQ